MSGPLRVVLVDLDHTLVDQTAGVRRMADRLDALLGADVGTLSAREIYLNLHALHARLWELAILDIRRYWLSERALLAVEAIRRADIAPDIRDEWGAFVDDGGEDPVVAGAFGRCLGQKIDALAALAPVQEYVRSALRSLRTDGDLIVRHDDVEMVMARLMSLGVHVYIVTEGDSGVQRFKFEQAGLGRWVPAERLVTTDDLVLPGLTVELKQYLRVVARTLGLGLDEASAARDVNHDRSALLARLRVQGEVRSALHVDAATPASAQLERLWDGLVALERITTSATTKTNPRFIRTLLNAIARNPDRPRDGVEAIFAGQPGAQAMQILAIGDRFDYDLWPLLSIYGSDVLSVHIRRGKYRAEEWSERRRLAGLPDPTFEVASFWEIERDLSDASALWARGGTVPVPSIVAPDDQATRERLAACLSLPPGSLPRRLVDVLLA